MKPEETFTQLIEQIARRNSIASVFSNFLEMAVCALSLGAKEERYLEIVRHYEKPDAYRMANAFGAMVAEMDNNGQGLHDMLGDFFMEHISHGHNGQFFTPQPICDMMAQLTGPIENGQRVYDCACGSGRTLLAAAKINRKAVFFGTDIDRNCCLMTLINLCLNGLQGEVAWMDSLSQKYYCAWHILIHPVHGVPYIKEVTEDECYQRLRPRTEDAPQPAPKPQQPLPTVDLKPVQAVQGTLF